MLLKSAIVVLALVGLALADQSIEQITHESNDSLVSNGPSNYGLSSSLLTELGWKTFSLDDNEATFFAADSCQRTRTAVSLLQADQLAQVKKAREQLLSRREEFINVVYQPDGLSMGAKGPGTWNMVLTNVDDFSISKYTSSVYSVTRQDRLHGISRLVFAGDTVTFVYTMGRVETKPIACLQTDEKQLVERVQSAVGKV